MPSLSSGENATPRRIVSQAPISSPVSTVVLTGVLIAAPRRR